MRRSSTQAASHIPRRSTSVDNAPTWSSQPAVLQSQTNLQVPSATNIGGRSSVSIGRASSIGRPSMSAGGKSEQKVLNANEIASALAILLQDLNYTPTATAKQLLIPSTATFYQLFEFLMKRIGVSDVWSIHLLAANSQNQNNPNSINPSSQNQQQNPIAQNKAKIELIAYHLQVLKYTNIPKANVLQTMTTPKNWLQMLLILQFLANNCLFLDTYQPKTILNSFDSAGDSQILNNYLKNAYEIINKQPQTEESGQNYTKLKQEALKRYAQEFKGEETLKRLTSDYETALKLNEQLKSNADEDKQLAELEQTLKNELASYENKLIEIKNHFKDSYNRIKGEKQEIIEITKLVEGYDKDLVRKEREYEQQRSVCKDLDKIAKRHTQKFQELAEMEANYEDLESKCNELQQKLMVKTQEVKNVIQMVNELIKNIKFCSSLSLDDLPELSVVDFHHKIDIIKQYKENIFKMREHYNLDICKLPDKFSHMKNEKKNLESKIENIKEQIAKYETENKKLEHLNNEKQMEHRNVLNKLKEDIEASQKKLESFYSTYENLRKDVQSLNTQLIEARNQQQKFQSELKTEIDNSKKQYDLKAKEIVNEISLRRSELIEKMQAQSKLYEEQANYIENYLKKLNSKLS